MHALASLRSLAALLISLVAAQVHALDIVAGPYLQYVTTDSVIVRWETSAPAQAEAAQGPRADRLTWTDGNADTVFQEVKLTGLSPDAFHFYQAQSTAADGAVVESEILTFQTAVEGDAPFAFIVVNDTQANPDVVNKIATLAWQQRPHFTLLVGDLVSTGTTKEHWTEHFFPNMHALNSRVALFPALGNHEKDAQFYYDYFSLPDPKYFYQFSYGNLEVFVLDSQRPLTPGSEQYLWLEGALAASKASWKIVALHKPPYSSDEDDYGDTRSEQSFGGDIMQRFPIELYEKHGVDIVWSGHIHSYERSHPMIGGKPVAGEGVLYMITGGGGGNLEKAAPWRMAHSAKVYSGHHYCLVSVHGPKLRIEAFDLNDRLFDFVELRK